MATVLPPEFFGIYGLGSSIGQVGEAFKQKGIEERERSKEELALMAQLNPNQRGQLLVQAEELGLIPPGSAEMYVPTAMELFQEGTPWEELSDTQQMILGPQLGLQPGQTPELARRGQIAGVEGAELGVQAARREEEYAQDFENALNSRYFKQAAGLPEDMEVTPGSIEAHRVAQGITMEHLNTVIAEARANNASARELAELENLRANTARTSAEIARLKATKGIDDGTAEWLKAMSQKTGWMPSMISAALDPDSDMPEDSRNAIVKDISQYQESLRATYRQQVREGNAVTGDMLATLVDWHKSGAVQIFSPDDQIWMDMASDALNEIGMPAAVVMEPGWWFMADKPRLATGEEAKSLLDQAAELVGDTSETPSVDAQTAAVYAEQVLGHYEGDPDKAIEAVRNSSASEADKRLLVQALTDIKGSEPAAQPEPEPARPEAPAGDTSDMTPVRTTLQRLQGIPEAFAYVSAIEKGLAELETLETEGATRGGRMLHGPTERRITELRERLRKLSKAASSRYISNES